MSERIGIGQAMLAAICASPFMAMILVATRSNVSPQEGLWKAFFGPVIGNAVLLLVPTVIANVLALLAVRWLGAGLDGTRFHIAVGVVSGLVLVLLIDRISRGMLQMGGGPLQAGTILALAGAAVINTAVLYVIWRLGWQPAGGK
jgi:hypothetical protein